MRVVLYNPRSSASRKPCLPMSLLALGATLEGREYRIVDGNLEPDPLATLDGLVQERPAETLLGVTVMPGPQLEEAVPLCRELARRHPSLVTVWGGYFPSQHWDACLRSDFVTYVVRGHGERVLPRLLASLESGVPRLEEIPGLAFRDGGGPCGGTMAPVPHPAELPDWDLDRVDLERYLRPTWLGRRTVASHTSYGCPFTCGFCAVACMARGSWLAQPAERVARTLATYRRRFGVDAAELTDNNFFVDEARSAELAERIRDLSLAWWAQGRVDTMLGLSQTTWQRLRDSGLRMVFCGAESGSPATLERMGKGGRLTPQATVELVRVMRGFGIVPELSFVLGCPPDPEADTAETMELIRAVKRANPATEVILYLYTPVPLVGELLSAAELGGFAFPATLDEWVSRPWLEVAQRRARLPWLRPALQRKIRGFERVLGAYYPSATVASLTPARRALLRCASAWRYHTRVYGWPLEVDLLSRLLPSQRPDTAGF